MAPDVYGGGICDAAAKPLFFQLREFVITCAVCLWLQIFGGVWGEDICGDDAAKETGSNFTNTTNSDREKKFY